jgi:hypothetical protein
VRPQGGIQKNVTRSKLGVARGKSDPYTPNHWPGSNARRANRRKSETLFGGLKKLLDVWIGFW